MKNLLFTIAFSALLASPAMAEGLTVTHSTAGDFETELNAALAEAQLTADQVTSLKVVSATATDSETPAEMNLTDFNALRKALSATLQNLDLSEATLKENGVPSGNTYGDNAGALRDMAELTNVTLPEGLVKIGGGAFARCKKLETINLPETITAMWYCAFKGCTNLKISKIPSGVKTIQNEVFRDCPNVTFSELPAGLVEVKDYGFYGCKAITVSEMPAGLKAIGRSAFASSGAAFSEWSEAIESVGISAFNGSKVTFTEWFAPEATTLPEGIFGYAYSLTDFTIPATVTELPKQAFFVATDFNLTPEGENYKRTLTCRNIVPPTAVASENDSEKNSSATFYQENQYNNHITFRVLKEALEAYQGTKPYSTMTIEALTTQMPVAVEGGEATVSTKLGEAAEGMLPVYEGNTTITITPADDMTIESVTYGETPVEVEDGVVTIDVPQTPETLTVTLKKSGEEAGVEGIASDDEIIATTYYNLQGVEISELAENGLYIRKQTTANGRTIVEKVMLKAM